MYMVMILIIVIAGLTVISGDNVINNLKQNECICNENFKRTLVSLLSNNQQVKVDLSIKDIPTFNNTQNLIMTKIPSDENYDGSYIIVGNMKINSSMINGILLLDTVFNKNSLESNLLIDSNTVNNYVCSSQQQTSLRNANQQFDNVEGMTGQFNVFFNNSNPNVDNTLNYFADPEVGPNPDVLRKYPGVAFFSNQADASNNYNTIVNLCSVVKVSNLI